MNAQSEAVKVWDLFVRVFHWTVVVAFFVAYFTEGDILTLHVWAGYTVGVLVLMRIVWGFVGPEHARFSDFIYSPASVWRYLGGLVKGRSKRYLGHSPAGGAMVIVLLASLLAIVWSGLELYAIEEGKGPLAGPSIPSMGLAGAAYASNNEDQDHNEHEEGDAHDFWEELHEVLANVTLALVILHVIGVVLSSVAHRENLIRSMVTGMKRREP